MNNDIEKMVSDDSKEVADRLKECRGKINVSLSELAASTGLSKATLNRYESGATQKIPLGRITVITKGLHVSPAYLMGWDKKEPDAFSTERETTINKAIEIMKELPDDLLQAALSNLDTILEISKNQESK